MPRSEPRPLLLPSFSSIAARLSPLEGAPHHEHEASKNPFRRLSAPEEARREKKTLALFRADAALSFLFLVPKRAPAGKLTLLSLHFLLQTSSLSKDAAAAPKALPCSLPAPTATTPAVKATTEAWTATGGNEVSKLSDMAALSFEKWLKSGAEGAASADAAAAACTSANVARYTVDVKSACKKISAEMSAENAGSAGMEYAIQYEVSYSCRAKGGSISKSSSSPSLAAKKANASAPSPALATSAAAAPLPSGPVKVEATLRALVAQPPLREAADGSLVRPKPLAKETWFVEVRSFF